MGDLAEKRLGGDDAENSGEDVLPPEKIMRRSKASKNRRKMTMMRATAAARRTRVLSSGCEAARLQSHKQPRSMDAGTKKMVSEGIQKSRFCQHVNHSGLEEFFEDLQYFSFEPDEVILNQGEDGDHFFVVETGQLEVVIDGNVANSMGPGAAFGGAALLYNCPRTATVKAKTASGVWGIEGFIFRRTLREQAEKNQAENLRLLERFDILAGLSNGQKSHIGTFALLRESVTAGGIVAGAGEVCKRLYVVRKGTLHVMKGGSHTDTGELEGGDLVREVKAGECFGEQFLLSEASATMQENLVAFTDCELVCVLTEKLAEMLGADNLSAQLEKAYVGVSLRRVPFIDAMRTHLQHAIIHSEVVLESCQAGQKLASLETICSCPSLVLVVEGKFLRDNGDKGAPLTRGDWCQDAEFSQLERERNLSRLTPRAAKQDVEEGPSLRPQNLVTGPSGGRIAVVSIRGIYRAISGSSELPSGSVEEVMGSIQKLLMVSSVPIFRGLADHQLDSLARTLQVSGGWKVGEVVFDQGEFGDKLFIVVSGEVRVDSDGKLLKMLGKGICFGERALLFDEPRSAKVTVTSAGTVFWTAQREVFERFVAKNMRDDLVERAKLQDWTLAMKNLKHIRMVGVGSFGSVRLVEHIKTGARYALKRIKKKVGKIPPEVAEECSLLREISHPFVLQLVKTFETIKSIYILTELITGGQLYDQMTERMGVLSRKHAQFYIGSLVLIIEALHMKGVIYRDLKPENVMLDSQGYVKLVDFGLAKRLDSASKTFSVVGTIYYMAPEVITGKGYGLEADVWSLGVMLFELVCGRLPFGEESMQEDGVVMSVLEDELEFPAKYNDNAGKKLIQGLLTKQPAQRIGAHDGWREIKEHKYFKASAKNDMFKQILSREAVPPFVPEGEQYSKEDYLHSKVTLSDSEELADDTQAAFQEKAKAMFKAFDLDGNGTIEKEELAEVLHRVDPVNFTSKEVDLLMSAIDTNCDGKIDLPEFTEFLMNADMDTTVFTLVLNGSLV